MHEACKVLSVAITKNGIMQACMDFYEWTSNKVLVDIE